MSNKIPASLWAPSFGAKSPTLLVPISEFASTALPVSISRSANGRAERSLRLCSSAIIRRNSDSRRTSLESARFCARGLRPDTRDFGDCDATRTSPRPRLTARSVLIESTGRRGGEFSFRGKEASYFSLISGLRQSSPEVDRLGSPLAEGLYRE